VPCSLIFLVHIFSSNLGRGVGGWGPYVNGVCYSAEMMVILTLSPPMSHLCNLTGKTEVIGLSGLMTIFVLTWGVYIANRRKEHSMFSETR
jgi:hypothetical protein